MKITVGFLSDKRHAADLFVAGLFTKERISRELKALEPLFSENIQTALDKKRFEGKSGQILSSYHSDNQEASEAMLLGLGDKAKYDARSLRKCVGQIIKSAKTKKLGKIRIFLDSFVHGKVKAQDAAAIFAEIALLSDYDFDKYKSKKKDDGGAAVKLSLDLVLKSKQGEAGIKKAVHRSEVIAEGVITARNLVNEPGNVMNATKMAQTAKAMAAKKKLSCKVLGESEIKRLKMGGILAVNQGSVTPPALIILEHGVRYKSRGTVCLVGKGVTFDTGGISIKPSRDMEKMKYDMGGAAAVIGTMGVVADLKLPVHVVGLAPAVENMVAANPQRPGDIIRISNGKTVEVLNTDAEGRLILADALAYTKNYKPKAIIDLATLTGMCVYTFSDKAIGMLGNDEKLLSKVKMSGEETGERCWELPLWDEYAPLLKGHHSDLYNIGGSYGGTITAAMFLKEFVPEKTPWVHLDIAGTAWCDHPRYDCVKGATGVGVRLLIDMLSSWR